MSERISYSEALEQAARQADLSFAMLRYVDPLAAGVPLAPILRALVGLVEEAREIRNALNAGLDPLSSGEYVSLDAIEQLIHSLAAGFDPAQEEGR